MNELGLLGYGNIDNDEQELKQYQQKLAYLESPEITEFGSPEKVAKAKEITKKAIEQISRRIRQNKNIHDRVSDELQAIDEAYEANRIEDYAKSGPLGRFSKAAVSNIVKTAGGAVKLYGTGKELAGFGARWASGDEGWLGELGREWMESGEHFNREVDEAAKDASGYSSEWAARDNENASLWNPSTWNPNSVARAGEGLLEFEVPMLGLGAVSGFLGKSLNPYAKTALEGVALGLGNIPEHSKYIEQTSGQFRPKSAIASGLISGQLMNWAFLAGRGRGLSEKAAMNYAQQVARSGEYGMPKAIFKEAALTGFLNSTVNGGVGGLVKEGLALPENPTLDDIKRGLSNVVDNMGREFVMGTGFGAHGAVKGFKEAKSLYNKLSNIGASDSVRRSRIRKASTGNLLQPNRNRTSEQFFNIGAIHETLWKTGDAIMKDKYPNLMEDSVDTMKNFLDEVQISTLKGLNSASDRASADFALQDYRDSMFYAQYKTKVNRALEANNISDMPSMGKVEKKDKNSSSENVYKVLNGKADELVNAIKFNKEESAKVKEKIKDKNTPFEEKQELARQDEELQAQRKEFSSRMEKPLGRTRAEVIESVRDLVARKYPDNPELFNIAMEHLNRFLEKVNINDDISNDDAIGLLLQVDNELNKLNPKIEHDSYNSDIEGVIIDSEYNTNIGKTTDKKSPSTLSISDKSLDIPQAVRAETPKEQPLEVKTRETKNEGPIFSDEDIERTGKPFVMSEEEIDTLAKELEKQINSTTKESTSSLNIPQDSKSENIPPKNKMKIDSTNKIGNKAVRDSESFDTRADMPQSVMTDRSESPAIKNERGKMGLDVEMKQKEVKNNVKTEKDTKYSKLASLLQKAGYKKGDEISKKELDKLARKAGFNGVENILAEVNETPFVNIGEIPLNGLKNKDGSSKMSETKYRIRDFSGLSEEGIKNRNTEYTNQQKAKEYAEEQTRLKEKYPILNDIDTNTKLWNAIENTNSKELQDILLAENAKRFEQARNSGNLKKWIKERKAFDDAKKPATEKSSAVENIIRGKKTRMTTKANGGMEADGEFAVVDVNSLKTATDIGETQNRDRKTVASQAQINSIGNNPNPEYLIVNNPDSANGAMVITADGRVLSGNGRTLGLKMAYESGNGEKYRAYLKEHAKEFGIDPKDVDKIKNPVLVRIVDPKEGFDLKRFVKESNESRQLGRNAAEIARTDAENIKGILREFNNIDDITSSSNKEFIQKFFEKTVGDTERANYLAEDGSLTPDGRRRVENALIASLYGDNSRLIEKLTNTTNEGIKNIANALIATAKDGAKLKGEVDKGMYFDVDLTKEIGDAALVYADAVAEMQRQGVKGSPINFYLANMKDRLTPEGKLVFGMLSELNKKPKQVREFLQIINDVIRGYGDPQQGDLFAGKNPKPSKSQIIKGALQEFDSRYKTDFSKQDLSKWNKSERTLFDIGNEVREDGTPVSVKQSYKNKRRSEWTEKNWREYNEEQNRIADEILGKEDENWTPIRDEDEIKPSKQKQNSQKALENLLPDIFEKYDRNSESPAPVQALMNILRGGESLADIEAAITRGDPREAIDIIKNIKQRVELTYSKDFSNKIAKNCDRLIKMIKNSNYRSKAIKPISLEELEAQPINRMPQEDVEGWREQRKAYLQDRAFTEMTKQEKRLFAEESRVINNMFKSGKITNEQRKLFHETLKADYDYNLNVNQFPLDKYQKEIVARERKTFIEKYNQLIDRLNNKEISFDEFVNKRHQLSIDYHTSLARDGIQSNAMRRMTIDPNRYKPQLSRTKDKTTNPVTDKELNNFLKGQAKQITKETGLNFKVVDSVDELRKMFPNNDITDTVEGGIHKDTVYLVKGNIDKDRLPLVIAHEVAGHRGVESLFESKQQMDNFFNSLERAAVKDKFIRDAFAEVDRLGYKENRSREAMAKIVEKVRNESGTLKGTAKTFVSFISSRVRRLLRKMGFKNLQLNEAEVYDIAVQALRRTGLKNSNKFFGLDRFLAKDNSFLSATSTELDQKYPGWSDRQTTSTGRHSTQAAITEKTYKKIGDWILNSNLKNSKILDASSGMGLGTEALRKMGLNVDDIEPYPGDRKIKPTYSGEDYLDYAEVYKKHGKTYDLIISNAVLNVIPDDWRKAQLHAMADVLLNKGGKLIINVRGDKEVANTKNKIILDSPNEILLPNGNGGYRAYQKGFSQKEFQDWVSKELGAGYKVEKLTPKNSGLSSSTTGVIVTKEGGNGGKRTNPRYEEITKQLNSSQLKNRMSNDSAKPLTPLKTLQGTPIKRYGNLVGKRVGGKDSAGGQIYIHKNYANEIIPDEILNKAKKILAEKNPDFKYNAIMWDRDKGTIRFDEAPNFDTAPEPIPGKILTINPSTGEIKEAYSDRIWHHKWLWVKDDYKGFDTKESWERSREWLNGLANLGLDKNHSDYSLSHNGIANGSASGYDAWNKQLKYYGLDHLIDDKNNTVPKADIQFSIGERKVKSAEEVARKTKEDTMDVRYPRSFDRYVKKALKQNIRQFHDEFMTKKNTGYKDAALKAAYWSGFDINQSRVEKAFKSIKEFDVLKKSAAEYIKDNILDDTQRARFMDKLVKAGTREGIYGIIQNTNIAREQFVRKELLTGLRDNLKTLRADKVPSGISMEKFRILGEHFTADELNSLLKTNKYSVEAVEKLRRVARAIRGDFEDIKAKTDIEVKNWAIGNARALEEGLDILVRNMKSDPSLNVSIKELGSVNTLLGLLSDNAKKAKEALVTDMTNKAVADRVKAISEMKPINEKAANQRNTYSIGIYNEIIRPVKALESLDNDNFTAQLGKTFHKIAYEDLLEGQNKQDHYRAEGGRIIDGIIDSFGGDSKGRKFLSETFKKVKTDQGHEYEITNNEAMSAVATYLDRETRKLIEKEGKVKFYLGDKKGSDSFTLTVDQLKEWENALSREQKEALRKGEGMLSNIFLPEMNNTHERLNGAPLRLIAGEYYPRSHVDMDMTSNRGLFDSTSMPYIHTQMNADYQSILKARKNGIPELRLRGFTDTLQSYVDQASLYIGMAEPLRHLNRVLTDGMKKEITQRYGIEYTRRLERMIRLKAGMAGKTESDKNTLSRYLSNVAAAKLTPVSALKQFSSVPLAASNIPFKYLAKAIIDGVSKANIDEMMKLDEMFLRYRNNGIAGIVPLNANSWEKERELQQHGDKWYNKVVDAGLNLSIEADKRALGIIYKATKLMAEAEGKGNDKAWIEKKFMETVMQTQNTTDLSSATGHQEKSRESSKWSFLNMYLNQTQKLSNQYVRLKRNMDEAQKAHGKDSSQYKAAKSSMVNYMIGLGLMNAISVGLGAGASAILHKKDEKKTMKETAAEMATDSLFNFVGNPVLKPVLGGSGYVLQKALPKFLGGKQQRTNNEAFGNDFSNLLPDATYTMGKIFDDLQKDEPAMKKLLKVTGDAIGSRSVESALAMGRVPTWYGRYLAQLIKKYIPEEKKAKKSAILSRSGFSRHMNSRRMRTAIPF